MNQILVYKENRKINFKVFFLFQLIISLLLIIISLFFIFNQSRTNIKEESISNLKQKNLNLSLFYNTSFMSIEENIKNEYAFRIIIEKIDLDYYVYNSYDEEKLRKAPCKFYGGNLEDNTNICVAAHNYDNNLFFGRIKELKVGDNIIIKDIFTNKEYNYKIFKKYQTKNDDMTILDKTYNNELTLLTCNNLNNKRIIIKAVI